ncbi:MAG: MoxR family ATPase [Thermoplasmata archaeon]
MANDFFTAKQVTFQEAKKMIRLAIRCGRPVFLSGSPGIGKSDLGEELAKDMGWKFCEVILTTMNPVDLRGIPIPDITRGKAITLPPDCLPSEPGTLVLLDEINAAPPTMQVAAYQLILKGRIGSYHLPPDCYVMACGNKPTDKAITYTMPTPLISRFSHLELIVDVDQWLQWAEQHGIDFRVYSFIRFAGISALFNFNPQAHTEAFACPRTWEYVSDYAKEAGDDIQTYKPLIVGTVGYAAAEEFFAFCEISDVLPIAHDIIINGNFTYPFPKRATISKQYGFILALVSIIRNATDGNQKIKAFRNLLKYTQEAKDMPGEFAILAIKDAIRSDAFLKNNIILKIEEIPELNGLLEMVGDLILPENNVL